MNRGIKTFVCALCGTHFEAPNIELLGTALSAPQRCPHCGSMRTRPHSILPDFIINSIYRKIWENK